MKKQLLVAVIALITLNNVHAMDTKKRRAQEIVNKYVPTQNEKSVLQSQKMDAQWEKDKDMVDAWKNTHKAHNQWLATNNETLENYKKLKCSFSLKNLANRLFYNKWYWEQKARLEQEERDVQNKRASRLDQFAHKNYLHEKNLFESHCQDCSTAISTISKPIVISERENKHNKYLRLHKPEEYRKHVATSKLQRQAAAKDLQQKKSLLQAELELFSSPNDVNAFSRSSMKKDDFDFLQKYCTAKE